MVCLVFVQLTAIGKDKLNLDRNKEKQRCGHLQNPKGGKDLEESWKFHFSSGPQWKLPNP